MEPQKKRKPRGKARATAKTELDRLDRPDLAAADRMAKRIGGNVRAMWEAKPET